VARRKEDKRRSEELKSMDEEMILSDRSWSDARIRADRAAVELELGDAARAIEAAPTATARSRSRKPRRPRRLWRPARSRPSSV